MDRGTDFSSTLDTKQAAKLLGLGRSTLVKMRSFGGGPPFLKLGDGLRSRVVYDRTDLQAWLQSRRRSRTNETEAAA